MMVSLTLVRSVAINWKVNENMIKKLKVKDIFNKKDNNEISVRLQIQMTSGLWEYASPQNSDNLMELPMGKGHNYRYFVAKEGDNVLLYRCPISRL